ncbi:MAG: hypothetical protein ACJAVV_001316 [Alphaproteobacteria bacterium]|jgi:hypothetical protein
MDIDIQAMIKTITGSVSDITGKDASTLKGFTKRQMKGLAKQSKLIALGVSTGEFDDEMRDFFLANLKKTTLNFAKSFVGMMLVTIEKIWNAVVGVLWGAINKATGLGLAIPVMGSGSE